MTMQTKANILVVDDAPANLRLLVGLLKDQGYKVRPAPSGRHGLAVAQSKAIDLVLLDIMMPEMDGYEVCRRLKAQETTRDVPVLFLSALNDAFDKVKAFEAGGVDYITKPFQVEEVLARVETHLSLRRMQQQLQDRNTELQDREKQLRQEINERKRVEEELRKANITKDTFFSIIAHDLRSPFAALLGFADLGVTSFETLSRDEIKNLFVHMKSAADAVYALLGNLLTWSRVQRGLMDFDPEPLMLYTMIAEIFSIFNAQAENKQIEMHREVPETTMVYGDKNMVCTAIRNLLSNALKFTGSGGDVTISAKQYGRTVEISVSDTGVGIPEEMIPRLFSIDEKISTAGTAGESGTGLGLPLCKDLIEKNKGSIRVSSTSGQGTVFIVTLPCPHPGQTISGKVSGDETESSLRDKFENSFSGPSGAPQMSMTSPDEKKTLTAGIAKLPKEWQSELRHAAEIIDIEIAEEVISRIRSQDAELAGRLSSLLQEFRYDIIMEALDGAEG